MTDANPTPLERVEALEDQVKALTAQLSRPRDPVSQRMLALVTIVCLVLVTCVLGAMKILTVEVIAAILGALAGRLTSNIGGDNEPEGHK